MMQEGTTALSADEPRELAAMGGELSIAVGADRSNIATEVPRTRSEALRLLADVAQRPRLLEADPLYQGNCTRARDPEEHATVDRDSDRRPDLRRSSVRARSSRPRRCWRAIR
jgi:hypothetical protein